MNDNKTTHDRIEDTDDCRASLIKAMIKHMRPEIPPEVQAGIGEFANLLIEISKDEFVCQRCKEKYRISGSQMFIF